jgi:crotonobetainyl-CoA:carnitine CoA-transferase CaiB-like acyl-CoA transferase
MFPELAQPKAGKVTVTNIPVKIPDVQEVPLQPAPELGEHTHAVLQELLGLDAETLSRLEQKGVI